MIFFYSHTKLIEKNCCKQNVGEKRFLMFFFFCIYLNLKILLLDPGWNYIPPEGSGLLGESQSEHGGIHIQSQELETNSVEDRPDGRRRRRRLDRERGVGQHSGENDVRGGGPEHPKVKTKSARTFSLSLSLSDIYVWDIPVYYIRPVCCTGEM